MSAFLPLIRRAQDLPKWSSLFSVSNKTGAIKQAILRTS